jgi:hypothetical protein
MYNRQNMFGRSIRSLFNRNSGYRIINTPFTHAYEFAVVHEILWEDTKENSSPVVTQADKVPASLTDTTTTPAAQ